MVRPDDTKAAENGSPVRSAPLERRGRSRPATPRSTQLGGVSSLLAAGILARLGRTWSPSFVGRAARRLGENADPKWVTGRSLAECMYSIVNTVQYQDHRSDEVNMKEKSVPERATAPPSKRATATSGEPATDGSTAALPAAGRVWLTRFRCGGTVHGPLTTALPGPDVQIHCVRRRSPDAGTA